MDVNEALLRAQALQDQGEMTWQELREAVAPMLKGREHEYHYGHMHTLNTGSYCLLGALLPKSAPLNRRQRFRRWLRGLFGR